MTRLMKRIFTTVEEVMGELIGDNEALKTNTSNYDPSLHVLPTPTDATFVEEDQPLPKIEAHLSIRASLLP